MLVNNANCLPAFFKFDSCGLDVYCSYGGSLQDYGRLKWPTHCTSISRRAKSWWSSRSAWKPGPLGCDCRRSEPVVTDMSIPVFTTPGFSKNADRAWHKDQYPCVICGKGIDRAKIVWGLHESGLGVFLMPTESCEPAADMGFQPIGPECRRAHPELKPYLIRSPQ